MSYSSNHSASQECHCQRRGPSSTSSSTDTPSLSGSLPSRSSSSSSLRPFPASEPSDYCKPTLSVNTSTAQHQRLAVLLSQDLWKRDSDADECDIFHCSTRFTLFERKHHCRRCGGVFCQACSSRTVPLLDTSNMPFMFPPAHIPIPLLAASSPKGHLIPSRVCDDCHAQLTGQTPPSVLHRRASAAESEASSSSPCKEPSPVSSYSSQTMAYSPTAMMTADGAGSSVHSASLYPPGTTFIAKPRHMRRPSTKRTKSSGSVHRASSSPRITPLPPHSPTQPQPDYSDLGVLAEYPLKVSSKGCKSSGAAWWNPKPVPRRIDSPVRYDAQVPRCVREQEECEPEDDDEDAPVVVVRRGVVQCSETKIREAPFAYLEERRGKDCVSFF